MAIAKLIKEEVKNQFTDTPDNKGMILSFGKTTAEVLTGNKSVTRRQWSKRTIAMWQKAWDEKRYIHQAWDKSPRNKGKFIGTIVLQERPYLEKLSQMPEEDLASEGFPELDRQSFIDRFFEGNPDQEVCVVRFKFEPKTEPEIDEIKPGLKLVYASDADQNLEDKIMIEAWLRKCEAIVEAFANSSGISEKQIIKDLQSKGGWFAEVTLKKAIDMAATWHFCQRATEEFGFKISSFTFEAFLKFQKLKSSVKEKIWEIFNSKDDFIINTKVLKKLKDEAIVNMSRLSIAPLAAGIQEKSGLIARQIVAQVDELIGKQNEETQELLVEVAEKATETTNLDDKASLKNWQAIVSSTEELAANGVDRDRIFSLLKEGNLEPKGVAAAALEKFRECLDKAKKTGKELVEKLHQASEQKALEIIRGATEKLAPIQLTLEF